MSTQSLRRARVPAFIAITVASLLSFSGVASAAGSSNAVANWGRADASISFTGPGAFFSNLTVTDRVCEFPGDIGAYGRFQGRRSSDGALLTTPTKRQDLSCGNTGTYYPGLRGGFGYDVNAIRVIVCRDVTLGGCVTGQWVSQ